MIKNGFHIWDQNSLILASDNYQEIEAQKTPRVSKDGTEREKLEFRTSQEIDSRQKQIGSQVSGDGLTC